MERRAPIDGVQKGRSVVSAEHIVGVLVAVALVGLLVAGVKFPDRF